MSRIYINLIFSFTDGRRFKVVNYDERHDLYICRSLNWDVGAYHYIPEAKIISCLANKA